MISQSTKESLPGVSFLPRICLFLISAFRSLPLPPIAVYIEAIAFEAYEAEAEAEAMMAEWFPL